MTRAAAAPHPVLVSGNQHSGTLRVLFVFGVRPKTVICIPIHGIFTCSSLSQTGIAIIVFCSSLLMISFSQTLIFGPESDGYWFVTDFIYVAVSLVIAAYDLEGTWNVLAKKETLCIESLQWHSLPFPATWSHDRQCRNQLELSQLRQQ